MEVQASLIQLGGKGVPKQKKPRVYRHPNASTSVQKSIKHSPPQEILKQRRTKLVQALTHIQHIYIYNLYYPSRCGQSLSVCKGVCRLTHVFTGQSNLVEAFGI